MLDLLHYSVCAQNGLDIAVYRKLFNKPKKLTSGSSSRSTKPSGKHQRTKCEGLRFILHRTVSRFISLYHVRDKTHIIILVDSTVT